MYVNHAMVCVTQIFEAFAMDVSILMSSIEHINVANRVVRDVRRATATPILF